MAKFLIIRLSSIGDIVLTTPVIRCLKEQVQDSEVHYLTKTQFRQIVENNPYIDKVHLFDGELSKTILELKTEKFDYIIDLHKNIRTQIIKQKLGTIAFAFDKLNFAKWLITQFKINILPKDHVVDRYLKTVDLFDVKNDHKGLDYFIPTHDEINIEKILPKLYHSGYVAVIIGAKHETKQLLKEKIVYVLNGITKPVLLLGSKEDHEKGEWILQNAGKDNVFNACGLFNLNQSASLVKQASCVMTNDTGLMHIAAAFHKKIVSVWGNTLPEFGMYPYVENEHSLMVEVKGLKCRPCSKLGFTKCPKGHFKCMQMIDERLIIDFLEKN